MGFSPATDDFDQVGTYQTASQTFTLTTSGEHAAGPLTVAAGGAASLRITADTCAGANLAPGTSCSVTVRFAPTAPGALLEPWWRRVRARPPAPTSSLPAPHWRSG
jgi:hypothetical protein